ncbi:MAG: hypothetical protein KDK70_21975, partial [Myxococcales bacterium]|nr:hypothetical protein [Myxococcales bacterium]
TTRPSTEPATTSPGSTDTDTTDTTADDEGATFIGGGDFVCVAGDDPWHCLPIECSLYEQDCPSGEKCVPWANDGGSAWNDRRCVPVAEDPVGVGEACTMEGSPYSGLDDCALGAMCWSVDAETLEGTCVALCGGTERAPTCAADQSCLVTNDNNLAVCLSNCDPLQPDCLAGETCIPDDTGFVCAPTSEAAAGEPCSFINTCGAGLVCASNPYVAPSCDESEPGCCTPWCDLAAPDPSAACFDPAQQCMPWWESEAPPGLETLGACLVPG